MANVIQIQLDPNFNPGSEQPNVPDYWIYGADIKDATHDQDIDAADRLLLIDPVKSAAWSALDREGKRKNMVLATNRIDLINWPGDKSDQNQPLEWPRTQPTNLTSEQQLAILCKAVIIYAGTIAVNPTKHSSSQVKQTDNVKKIKADEVEREFFHNQTSIKTEVERIIQDPDVLHILRPLFGIKTPSYSRGRSQGNENPLVDLSGGYLGV